MTKKSKIIRSPDRVERIAVAEFLARLKAQGVPRVHAAFKCPICQTVQSMHSLIVAGAGASEDDVEKYIGFSCVGRFTDAGPFQPGREGAGCDWSLGGLFQLHRLEVVTDDGAIHPRFIPATPDEAQALMRKAPETVIH